MKKCAYCGRENDDDATQCRECGTGEFLAPGPAPTQPRVEAGKDESETTTPAQDANPELFTSGESAVCPTCHTHHPEAKVRCDRRKLQVTLHGSSMNILDQERVGLLMTQPGRFKLTFLCRVSRSDGACMK